MHAAGRAPRGTWNISTVWKILLCPLHAGLVHSVRFGLVKGEHWDSRYYDPEVFEQILAAKEGRRKFSRTNTGSIVDDRLLNGLPTCARCGSRLKPTSHSAASGGSTGASDWTRARASTPALG
jgi:hypothetical protein